jgi:hypothetical protein
MEFAINQLRTGILPFVHKMYPASYVWFDTIILLEIDYPYIVNAYRSEASFPNIYSKGER